MKRAVCLPVSEQTRPLPNMSMRHSRFCRVWGCHGSHGGGADVAAGEETRPYQGILLHATVHAGTENLKEYVIFFFPLHFHCVWVQSRMVSIERKPNPIIKSLKEEKRRELVKNFLSEAHLALPRRDCALLH